MIKEFFQRYGGTRATGSESNAYASASPEFLRSQISTYEEMRRTCQKPSGGGRLTQGEFVEVGRTLVLMKSALLRHGRWGVGLKPLSGAHSKHVLTYHLVWCVKYRRTVMTREIGDRAKDVLREIAERIGVEVVEAETDVDHVHVIVRLKPTHTVAGVLHRFKDGSAYRLFRDFPYLRRRLWGGHLWSPSYFASTVGGVTLEKVKKYVQEQRAEMAE